MALRLRRGTNAERVLITPADGELIYTIDTKKLYIGDGTQAGGNPVDTAGEFLGSNLDLNNYNINGVGNINTDGNITVTGSITADGNLTLGGNLTIGDATSDTVNILAKVESHVIPDVDGARNIGSSSNKFNQGWFNTIHVASDDNAINVNANIIADDSTVLLNKATGALNASGTFKGDVEATDNSSFFNATSKAVNAGDGTFAGNVEATTFTGTLVGDVKGSLFADDSTVLVDGLNGTLSNGTITFNEGYLDISSTPGIGKKLTIGRDTDVAGQGLIFKAGAAVDNIIDVQSLSTGDTSSGINVTTSRGSLATKTTLQAGDTLWQMKQYGHDGTNENTLVGNISFKVEEGSTVSNGAVPGKIFIITTPDDGSTYNGVTVDSAGRFTIGGTGIAQADSALDVTGNARVSGYIMGGSLTTVERDALTPEAGMIIYNTTENEFQGRTGVAWVALH